AACQAFAVEGGAAVAGFLGDPGGGRFRGRAGGGHVGGPRRRDGVIVVRVRNDVRARDAIDGRKRLRRPRRRGGGRFGGRSCGGRGLGAAHGVLHASRTRPGRPAAAGVAFGTARVSRRRRRNRDRRRGRVRVASPAISPRRSCGRHRASCIRAAVGRSSGSWTRAGPVGAAEAANAFPDRKARGFRRSYNSPFLLVAVASREAGPPSANDGGRFQLPLRGSAGMGPVKASAPASLFIRWRAPPEPTDTTYSGSWICQYKMLWNIPHRVPRPRRRGPSRRARPGDRPGGCSEAQVDAGPEAAAFVDVPVAVEGRPGTPV